MDTLKKERRWCVRGQNKMPYRAVDVGGMSNDSSTWLSYEEAQALWEQHPDKFTGLGVYFSEKEGDPNLFLCGIDIDSIDHDSGQTNPLAEEILNEFRGTYAEWSPSKTGFHILLYIDKDRFPFSKTNYPFYEKNSKSKLEAYVGTISPRYFTYTGNKLEAHNNLVTDQTEQFLAFLTRYMSKPRKKPKEIRPISHNTNTDDIVPDFDLEERIKLIRNSPWEKRFEALYDRGDISEYESASEADYQLICILVPWLEGNATMLDRAFRQSALFRNGRSDKWDCKRGERTYGELTISAAIAAVEDPYYSEDPGYAAGDSISPEDIVRIIDEVYQDEENKEKVSVLPFACGLGKSTAISYKIAEVLESEGTDGLIIVTDKIERMYKYAAPEKSNLKDLKEYLELHRDEISILEHNTIKKESVRQFSCRILILSTQRYFQQITREKIINYTHWAKGRRTLILIDEQPGVLEQKMLTIRDLSMVGDMLHSLQPREGNVTEQDWCIEQWEKVSQRIRSEDTKFRRRKVLEDQTLYYFCQYNNLQMTEDDERFFKFISDNSSGFFDEDNNSISTIQAARHMLTSWAIVERYKANNKLTVRFVSLIDHKDKILNVGAKVIILDGTADLSPEYEADIYDFRQSPVCRRWLDRLHIYTVNYPTSREALSKENLPLLAKKINDFAWRNNKGKDRRSVVFTYKAKNTSKPQLETELNALFNNEQSPCNVDHFGAIRGKNEYDNASFFIQFGLYQYPHSAYMLYYLYNNPDFFDKLKKLDEEKASDELKKLENSFSIKRIRNRCILTDIEQNFFRGSIRQSGNDTQMKYYIFFKLNSYNDLRSLMLLRYLSLHAEIVPMRTPKEFQSLNGAHRQNKAPEILKDWLDKCRPGRTFTYETISKETGITANRISQIRNRHPEIDDMFKRWQDKDNKRLFHKPRQETKYTRRLNQIKAKDT